MGRDGRSEFCRNSISNANDESANIVEPERGQDNLLNP